MTPPNRLASGWMLATLLLGTGLFVPGCRSTPDPPPILQARDDSRLRRLTDDGRRQFAEGDVDAAIKNYRKAIRRAWALDDPVEIGNVAFNLAATLFSLGRNDEARDWLIESRSELIRGHRSVGNTWLLEAKIARGEGRILDAQSAIQLAQTSCVPCQVDQTPDTRGCGADPCDQKTCGACLPLVGEKLVDQRQQENCTAAYQAQITLAKALLANDFGDVVQATTLLGRARQTIQESCQRDLRGEVENVAAHIHLSRGEPLQAAVHFDREADALRAAGNLRQIPFALQSAADAYSASGRLGLAADRWARAARIFHGRGDQRQAWRCVTSAVQTATGVHITHPAISSPVVTEHESASLDQETGSTGNEIDPSWSRDLVCSDLISFRGCTVTTDVTERRLATIAREIQRAVEHQ